MGLALFCKREAAGEILHAAFCTLAATLLPCNFAELLVLVHADLVFAVALWGQPRELLELVVEIADVVIADACAHLGDREVGRDEESLCLPDAAADDVLDGGEAKPLLELMGKPRCAHVDTRAQVVDGQLFHEVTVNVVLECDEEAILFALRGKRLMRELMDQQQGAPVI